MIKNCLVCSQEFKTCKSNINRNGGKFCSQRCAAFHNKNIFKTPSFISPQERFFKNISNESHTHGCWIWVGLKNKQGYGRIIVDKKEMCAHRYSFLLHNNYLDSKLFVCHSCDNPSCVNPEHLWLGSISENAKDMVSKGRNRDDRGSKHPMSKLNEEKVLTIRQRLKKGEKRKHLAEEYLVSTATIDNIALRKSWTHI